MLKAGLRHHQTGQLAEAERLYRQVLAIDARHTDALHLLGLIAHQVGQNNIAVELIGKAIEISPAFAAYHANLGIVLQALGRPDKAAAAYNAAIRLQPDFTEAYSNLGNTLLDLERLDDAVAAYNAAIRLQPDFAQAHSNLGNALQHLGQLDDAVAAYNNAIRFKPDFAEAHYYLGLGLLLSGDLSNGWREHEWRWLGGHKELKARGFTQPLWRGEDLHGRTILLHAEQGLGDTIQFCRYASLVADRGGRVVLEAPRALLRLLSGLQGVDRLIAAGEPLPAFDFHCPLMSLPTVFGTTLATIPATIPYIHVKETRRQFWQQRLGPSSGRRVGIVWAGNPKHKNDRNRSLPFAALTPLWNIPGIRWYSLQVGERQTDLIAAPPGVDFAETAAAMSQLDLVVTVDTSVAHLAGAIGRSNWVMLPFAPDSRWLTGRQDSPWYPSVRLFRQTERGEWGHVMNDIAAALAVELVDRPAAAQP